MAEVVGSIPIGSTILQPLMSFGIRQSIGPFVMDHFRLWRETIEEEF